MVDAEAWTFWRGCSPAGPPPLTTLSMEMVIGNSVRAGYRDTSSRVFYSLKAYRARPPPFCHLFALFQLLRITLH